MENLKIQKMQRKQWLYKYTGSRNFNTVPREMCTWCGANDSSAPYADWRPGAVWRTIEPSRPWTTDSPFHRIPGGSHENIISKDLLHLCHLGATRTFCVSLLCYLTVLGRLAPGAILAKLFSMGCAGIIYKLLFGCFVDDTS